LVGLVLVCHSEPLARHLVELVRQVAPQSVPIAVAAGIDDPQHPFGTDATRILAAIDEADRGSGVLLLMDLGSALLAADTALELLDPSRRARVRLCGGPLVEGAMAAAARAAAGGSLEEVAAEAEAALLGKQAWLSPGPPPALSTGTGPGPQGGAAAAGAAPAERRSPQPQERRARLANRLGLHARPAAQFVQAASRFRARVQVTDLTRGAGPVNGLSLNRLATLGAVGGHELLIRAEGEDAGPAADALAALVETGFGEPAEERDVQAPALSPGALAPREPVSGASPPRGPAEESPQGTLSGVPASPGIALGPAFFLGGPLPAGARGPGGTPAGSGPPTGPGGTPAAGTGRGPERERRRLQEALEATERRVRALAAEAVRRGGGRDAAIFEAHLLSLRDPDLLEAAHRSLEEAGRRAEDAWRDSVDRLIAAYRALDDPYLRERAADLEYLLAQVLAELAGTSPIPSVLPGPCILLCGELSPADLIRLDPGKLLGIASARGSADSHAAILARSLGVPAVAGLGPVLFRVPAGTPLALDGGAGRLWIDPPDSAALRRARAAWLKERRAIRRNARRPAATRDGRRILIEANVQDARDAEAAAQWGADGIGVLRTEFLYIGRERPPAEEEQVELYRAVADRMAGGKVVVRTFDIGGDKDVAFLRQPPEMNPFLGVRGSRLYARFPEIFRTQLRALLRAGAERPIEVLFPMITAVGELRRLREVLSAAGEELRRQGLPCQSRPAAGVMIEVPAAALQAGRLAGLADFFSIGTNDLAQYLFAVDRTSAPLAGLADPFHPALLGLIRAAVRAAASAGIPAAVCGELAGVPAAAPLLIGLGVEELSMSPPAIPRVKEAVGGISFEEARRLADRALTLESAAEVRELVAESFPRLA
jgi:phosphocarrier protein FPr